MKERGQAPVIYGLASTLAGNIFAALVEEKLALLILVGQFSNEKALAELRADFPEASLHRDDSAIAPVAEWLNAYWTRGNLSPRPLPLQLNGTPFQIKVWEELRRIPFGQTACYSEVALRLGIPTATRAVASAIAANRIAIIVPCHRVLPKSGKVGNFRWGSATKEKLLNHEWASVAVKSEKHEAPAATPAITQNRTAREG